MIIPFNKKKYSIHIVMNYLAIQHGTMDMFNRYSCNRIRKYKKNGFELKDVLRIEGVDSERIELVSRIYNEDLIPTLPLGKISLKSRNNNRFDVSVDDLSEEYVDNHPLLLEHQAKASSMLIISAYELSPKIEGCN